MYIYKSGLSTIVPTFSIAFLKFCSISYPLIYTFPEVIFWSPNISFIVVVLPAPFGPINPKISPSNTFSDTPFKISFWPKILF